MEAPLVLMPIHYIPLMDFKDETPIHISTGSYKCNKFAQGNLQFNQVLNFNYSASGLGSYASSNVATVTIPTGKVWKITSASSEKQNDLTGSAIKVDNHVLYKDKSSGSGQAMSQNTPHWLQGGTHTITLSNLSSSTMTIHGSISIIEFNVVP